MSMVGWQSIGGYSQAPLHSKRRPPAPVSRSEAVLALAALFVLMRTKINSARLVLDGGALGVVLKLVGW